MPEGGDSETVVRETAIFVPTAAPFDGETWAEGVLGNIVRPVVRVESGLSWFWFTRYAQPRAESEGGEGTAIPRSFAVDGLFRSVRFRYAVPSDGVEAFERRTDELAEAVGARTSDVRDYDWLLDLGADRFAGAAPSPARTLRAHLVADFLCSLCRLALDCLAGPDEAARYRFEENFTRSNPNGSPFESLHHLFCNITAVPTSVLVSGDHVGTHWTPPPPSRRATEEKRVWF